MSLSNNTTNTMTFYILVAACEGDIQTYCFSTKPAAQAMLLTLYREHLSNFFSEDRVEKFMDDLDKKGEADIEEYPIETAKLPFDEPTYTADLFRTCGHSYDADSGFVRSWQIDPVTVVIPAPQMENMAHVTANLKPKHCTPEKLAYLEQHDLSPQITFEIPRLRSLYAMMREAQTRLADRLHKAGLLTDWCADEQGRANITCITGYFGVNDPETAMNFPFKFTVDLG